MKFKGAIFDLDGTLVDSIEDLAESMNTVLKENNFPEHEIDKYKLFVGNGIKTLVRRSLPAGSDEETVSKCYLSMMNVYDNNCVSKSRPYDGIRELLQEFTDKKIKLAVLSNKADNLTKKIIYSLFPEVPFVKVVGLVDENLKKPNPESALAICREMHASPDEVLFLGDTAVDMQTAKKGGFVAIGVLWGFRGKDELIEAGADIIVEKPVDLMNFLDSKR
ncbi:MAG TPA: HAD family hydrolase [Bacteroidales bacterium]|nr:HAD family hydrolase [Bacteroidales bacterium]